MEVELPLPGEEDADGPLAGVRCRVTGGVIVDLRTCGNKEENGGDESCFDAATAVQIVCCSAASSASDTPAFTHAEKNQSEICQELKLAPLRLPSRDASSQSNAAKGDPSCRDYTNSPFDSSPGLSVLLVRSERRPCRNARDDSLPPNIS